MVTAEVDGLRRPAERLGDEPAERLGDEPVEWLLLVIADAFRLEARTSDWVACIGNGRLAEFLPDMAALRWAP